MLGMGQTPQSPGLFFLYPHLMVVFFFTIKLWVLFPNTHGYILQMDTG